MFRKVLETVSKLALVLYLGSILYFPISIADAYVPLKEILQIRWLLTLICVMEAIYASIIGAAVINIFKGGRGGWIVIYIAIMLKMVVYLIAANWLSVIATGIIIGIFEYEYEKRFNEPLIKMAFS